MINGNEDFKIELDKLFEICQICTMLVPCKDCPVKKKIDLLSERLMGKENKQ